MNKSPERWRRPPSKCPTIWGTLGYFTGFFFFMTTFSHYGIGPEQSFEGTVIGSLIFTLLCFLRELMAYRRGKAEKRICRNWQAD